MPPRDYTSADLAKDIVSRRRPGGGRTSPRKSLTQPPKPPPYNRNDFTHLKPLWNRHYVGKGEEDYNVNTPDGQKLTDYNRNLERGRNDKNQVVPNQKFNGESGPRQPSWKNPPKRRKAV